MTSVHVVDALELIADRYGEEARKKELPDEPDIVVKALLRTVGGSASVTLGSVFKASSASCASPENSEPGAPSDAILVDWEASADLTPFDHAMMMSMEPAVVLDSLRAQVSRERCWSLLPSSLANSF